jgi:heme-degrading monooxygenase HmoA
MYIAMNRFEVVKGREADFEAVWRSRPSRLATVPGFIEFHLLRGPEANDFTLYSSHTVWTGKAAFVAWTESEAFREAHRTAGEVRGIYRGHPVFEGFEVVSRLLPQDVEAA